MTGLGEIWQAIHQILSDPALQGIGTVISIAGSSFAVLKSKKSSESTHHLQGKKKVEIYTAHQRHTSNTLLTHPQHVTQPLPLLKKSLQL